MYQMVGEKRRDYIQGKPEVVEQKERFFNRDELRRDCAIFSLVVNPTPWAKPQTPVLLSHGVACKRLASEAVNG